MKIIRFLVLFLIPSIALGQLVVKVDRDESADFSKYRTYQWVAPDSIPLVRGRISEAAPGEKQIDSRIRAAIEQELQAKGLSKQDGQSSDLLINYLGLVTFRSLDTEASPAKGPTKASPAKDATEGLITYEHWKVLHEGVEEGYIAREGTLTVDIVDAKTNRLVWRGSATDVVNEPVTGPQQLAALKKIDEAVRQLFQKFLSQ